LDRTNFFVSVQGDLLLLTGTFACNNQINHKPFHCLGSPHQAQTSSSDVEPAKDLCGKLQAIAWKLRGTGSSQHNVTSKSGIGDLSHNVFVGKLDNIAVLWGVVLVLVMQVLQIAPHPPNVNL
jgi:hypothetical protein